jgi:phytoene dehydrogenase-like protein
VTVYEAEPTIGGGARSMELTLPGFIHDVCSAVHPFAIASPFFKSLPLDRYGLQYVQPEVMVAHPFDDGTAAWAVKSVDETARGFAADAEKYKALIGGVVDDWPKLESAVLGNPIRIPKHPIALARFGLNALQSIEAVASRFDNPKTRAFLAGHAAHGMLPLDHHLTGGFALTLAAMCHSAGWGIPRGGSQEITNALVAHLRSLGGAVIPAHRIATTRELPPVSSIMFDLSPRPLLAVAAHEFTPAYRRKLSSYKYGMGTFKVDWALDAPAPWTAEACRRAGTVHIGGNFEEIAASEKAAWEGRISERPFVLFSQPTLIDPSRAPAGKHIAWGYCHVPNGSTTNMLDAIERQIERFAPGFRDRVIGRSVMNTRDIEAHNANLVGGDIGSGMSDLRQFFTRPTWRAHKTSKHGMYICSAASPPGVGVHGMCGYYAATLALAERDRH